MFIIKLQFIDSNKNVQITIITMRVMYMHSVFRHVIFGDKLITALDDMLF